MVKQGDSNIKCGKTSENIYEDFIDEASKSVKKNDNGRKNHRKALLKRNQEELFDEASRLREKCNDRGLTKKCKKNEKFVERRLRKRRNAHIERRSKEAATMEKLQKIITKNLSMRD